MERVYFKEAKSPNKALRRAGFLLKLLGWIIMWFIISEFLIQLNPETVISNWGIGLIGMIVFGIFYSISDVKFFLFKIDRFNAFMVTFFLAWFIADWDEFIQVIIQLILI